MKYIFAGLSIKGLVLNVDLEKLKTSQDKSLANDFLEVVSEKNELEIGSLKFKYISSTEDMSVEGSEKRRKF